MPVSAFDRLPRAALATLPTALEAGPELPGGARLWVKRDDLTGLGGGGNKARKLEFLCGAALAAGCDALVTVGAAQSNHCRMTAAAGARLGLETHLVLGGDRPARAEGNQVLDELFGAQLHFTGAAASHWGELEIAREAIVDGLAADGVRAYSIPIGGSTAVGAVGYALAYVELAVQCAAAGISPRAVVVTTSSGGTHAGLVAGRELCRAGHADGALADADIVAVAVAKGVAAGYPDIAALATEALALVDPDVAVDIGPADVAVETAFLGDDYAIPTTAGDEAIRWAARRGGWVLDRVYSGKGFSGLLGLAESGRWGSGDDVVFVHTGGWPALFTAGGAPEGGGRAQR